MCRAKNSISTFAAAIALAACAATASAAQIDIGGGWRATWDSSLDPFVNITPSGVTSTAVHIIKSATFTQPPVNGIFSSILIQFTQTSPNAVPFIVIDHEVITNNTGAPWTDFHMFTLDSGDVHFDPAATLASGGPGPIGWDVAPFTTASFANSDTLLDVAGGVIPNGAMWLPGFGPNAGDLWIAATIRPQAPFTTFTLKEIPTPEPTTLLLAGLGLAFSGVRRRITQR